MVSSKQIGLIAVITVVVSIIAMIWVVYKMLFSPKTKNPDKYGYVALIIYFVCTVAGFLTLLH